MDYDTHPLAVDNLNTFKFFLGGLKIVSGDISLEDKQLLYTASILAHHAQTSRATTSGHVSPGSLSDIFDQFVFRHSLIGDPDLLETAGAQCMIMSGFFQNQSQRRHKISWYSEIGSGFYWRASQLESSRQKARVLHQISEDFELWRGRCALLSDFLRYQRYLLNLDFETKD